MSDTLIIILITYFVSLAALLGTLIFKGKRKYFFPVKVICSLLFILLGLYCNLVSQSQKADHIILIGFVFCFVGDVILGLFNTRKNKKFFLWGTLFFLLGHITFILATYIIRQPHIGELAGPLFTELMLYILLKKKTVTMKNIKPLLYIYALFVSGFAARSISIFIDLRSAGSFLLMVGSLLFFISDTLILFLYFVRDHRWSTHGWNLATYYVGMGLIGLSILF